MAIFWPKAWVNPWTFWTSCFYSLERRFIVLDYRKTHLPSLYRLKKKMEKWPFFEKGDIFYQKRGLTPLEKSQI